MVIKKILYLLLVSLLIIQQIETKKLKTNENIYEIPNAEMMTSILKIRSKVIILWNYTLSPSEVSYFKSAYNQFASLSTKYSETYQFAQMTYNVATSQQRKNVKSAPTFEIFIKGKSVLVFTDYTKIEQNLNKF